eukprot:g55103.t1
MQPLLLSFVLYTAVQKLVGSECRSVRAESTRSHHVIDTEKLSFIVLSRKDVRGVETRTWRKGDILLL